VVVAVTALGCSSGGPYTVPRLQVLGDSITVLSAPQLHERFDRRYDVDIDAFVGVTTAGMVDAARTAATAHPEVVVVNLGTNDVGCVRREWSCTGPYSAAQTEANLETIATAFGPSACVIFVDLNTHVLHRTDAEALNRFIHATFPRVVDWAGAYQRSWFSSPIDPHPDAAGRAHLVDLIDRAVSAC